MDVFLAIATTNPPLPALNSCQRGAEFGAIPSLLHANWPTNCVYIANGNYSNCGKFNTVWG